MKARPILFSGEMVKAIMDGRKSQTRRVIKPQPELFESYGAVCMRWKGRVNTPLVIAPECLQRFCPYGQPGDRLWVRETFAIAEPGVMARNDPGGPVYAADYPALTGTGFGPWKPSIFMPRAISRITLEVTGLRVERVRDIKDEDFVPEGFPYSPDRYEDGFAYYWEKLNAKRGYGWDVNPWVWVLTFQRVQS